jgi:integrase
MKLPKKTPSKSGRAAKQSTRQPGANPGSEVIKVLTTLLDKGELTEAQTLAQAMTVQFPTTKSGRPRHVPLSDGVLKLLASVPHDPDCPWIFANPKTKKPYVSVFISWNTARKNAGLAEVRMHDLRHSFASFLVNAGRSLYEVQKILGHTQVKTTQRYNHLAQETLVDACNSVVNSLGDAFGPVAVLGVAT